MEAKKTYKTPRGPAANRAKQKYNAAHYVRVAFDVTPDFKQIIKDHATGRGESVNGFIKRAINETIQRETKTE